MLLTLRILMLTRLLWRWNNIKTTLVQDPVVAGGVELLRTPPIKPETFV